MGRSGQHLAALAGEDPQLDRRIRDGLAFAITDRGYLATTVADIARQARVPVSVVYERYGDREGCFLAFYRHTTSALLQHVQAIDRKQAAAGMDWRARVHGGVRAYLAALAAGPALSQVALLEIGLVGPQGRQARREALDGYAAMLDALTANHEAQRLGVRALGPHDALAVVGAVHELVVHHIDTVGAERLVELTGPVSDVIIRMVERR